MIVDAHRITFNLLLILLPFKHPRSGETDYSSLTRWVAFEDDRSAILDLEGDICFPKRAIGGLKSAEVFQRRVLAVEQTKSTLDDLMDLNALTRIKGFGCSCLQ
jgi:hypothetical protein